jgi:hypothetical protein
LISILLSGFTIMFPAVVADAGAGGQVLMDEDTFLNVKERLEELGAVDGSGLNYAKLNAARTPSWLRWR